MSKTKVVLRVNTKGAKKGDTIEVADAETAQALFDSRQALPVPGSPHQSTAAAVKKD